MRIALTYDLRSEYLAAGFGDEDTAEFDRESTIDAIEAALATGGHATVRVGSARALARRLADGEGWDLVFNICEGVAGYGREAQVPALLEAFGVGYTFSDPLVCALTLHKAMAKRVMRDAGLPTPAFHLVESERDLEACELAFPVFVKPVAEGTAKGIDASSRVESFGALRERCLRLIETYRQPALVEAYLPGREFTVGILGTGPRARVAGTLEVVLGAKADPGSYTYRNKELSEELCEFPLADRSAAARVEPLALAAWRLLGGRDAGRIDLRLDAEGAPQLLEVNPLPGLHPSHSDLPMLCAARGMPFEALIAAIVGSATRRLGGQRRARPGRSRAGPSLSPPPRP